MNGDQKETLGNQNWDLNWQLEIRNHHSVGQWVGEWQLALLEMLAHLKNAKVTWQTTPSLRRSANRESFTFTLPLQNSTSKFHFDKKCINLWEKYSNCQKVLTILWKSCHKKTFYKIWNIIFYKRVWPLTPPPSPL